MPKIRKIGLRDIRALGPGGELWETSLPGFGARRQKSEAVSYFVSYRAAGKQPRHTIGRHGAPWTPDTAREEAKRILGQVAAGANPSAAKRDARKALTVNDLCDLYMTEAEAGRLLTRRRVAKKASTLTTDRSRIDRHIKPLLGALLVTDVTSEDVETFLHSVADGKTALREKTARKHGLSNVRGGRGAASRTTGLLGGIFEYAVKKRLRADNPVRGVLRFADQRRERRLTEEEYGAFSTALSAAGEANVWPAAVSATRFLLLTGWRLGEALGLRKADVDLATRTALLPDTKTGRSLRPLSTEACEIVRGMSLEGELVFPGSRREGRMSGFAKMYRRIATGGSLPADVTPHTLRHSYASLASDLGYSEATVAALIGHKGHSITSRYIHSADAVLLAAADAVADAILVRMGERSADEKVVSISGRRVQAAAGRRGGAK